MSFFSEIKKRLNALVADFKTRQRIERLDRADVLLAHRIVARRRWPSIRQWHLVGRVLRPEERRLIHWAVALMALGAILIVARWALLHTSFVPTTGGEYREGIVGSPRAVNPILAGNNDVDQDLIHLIYNGLYRRDAQGNLALDLARSVEVSSDGKSYVFTLKPDAVFHDGQPVTAADVVFTINAILNPAWKSPLAGSLAGLTATARDDRSVAIVTKTPSSYLPSLLTFGVLPEHIWGKVDPKSPALIDFNLKPIGSGPFRFDSFSRDGQGNILTYAVRATKNSGAKLDRIVFKFYDDYDSAVDALSSNAVDGLNFVPPGKREAIRTIPGVTVRSPALAQATALFLNPQHDAALADSRVRQALAYALDREKIVRVALNGLGSLQDQPLPNGAAGSTADVTHYDYDPAKAAALLDQAGYPVAADTKIRTKTETSQPKSKKDQPVTTSIQLTVTISAIDSDEGRATAEIIKENWAALGVKTDVIAVEAQTIQKSVIRPREYDALLFGELLGADTDPFPFWHSSQIANGVNLAAYSNRRVDELLEKARVAVNETERAGFLAEFQKIVTQEEPAIFLYQPDYLYPQSAKIKDFAVSLLTVPADRFANVTAWYRKFKLAFK